MRRPIVAAAAVLLLGQGAATAETFDLYVFGYCPTGMPLCGFASEQAYQNRVLAAVQEVNIEWEAAGISFRPTIFPIVADNFFSLGEGCDPNVSDTIKAIRQLWREQVAALYPNAVSVMVTPNASWCCSPMPKSPYVANPPDPDDAFPNLLGIFCTADWNAYKTGVVWAHELGHYFCLRHTQTFQDPADNTPVDHDNDDCCGVNDTPPDPSRKEGNKPGGDIDADDNPINGHEWCEVTPTAGLTDDGSPHSTLCDPVCYLYDNDQQTETGYEPHTQAAMNYFHEGCHGPYVVNGQTFEAFSPDSIVQIRDVCLTQVPDRVAMPDVCAGHGGDTDNDGICQDADNCPVDKNTSQQDQDMDGTADGCDLCPMNPSPTGDIDGDGIGDICDPDMDGDTCDNDDDQHPDQGQVRVGYRFNSSCGFGIEPIYESEEVDADNDGVKSCLDVDDDNDGICDDAGPVDPNAPGQPPPPIGPCTPGPDPCLYAAGGGCYVIEGSPNDCQPDWFVCLGGGCVEFLMKIVSVINPADQVVFDRFHIWNRAITVPALPGHTASQTAKMFQGEFGALKSPSEPGAETLGGPVRLEIWSRGSARASRRVAIVGEYGASQVSLGNVTRGGWLVLTPTIGPTGIPLLQVDGASLANRMLSPQLPADTDGDGRFDMVDLCTSVADFLQADADADGYGDLCDADIDNDLRVTTADVDLVRGCEGADLKLEIPLNEPGSLDNGQNEHPPEPVMIQLAIRCAAMDLDGDGDVDPADTGIAAGRIGTVPGPSARTEPDMGCGVTNCDDGLPCTTDYCDPLSGQCAHVEGGCDDHNVCTTDACNTATGQCEHGPVACDDGNPCTRDVCDPAGGCAPAPEPDGLPCDDGSLCTADDMCFSGQCNGRSMLCDDGNSCTNDTCDPSTGQCVFPPTVCDDGNPCTRDLCGAAGGCAHFDEPDGLACSDGDLCTQADRCSSGACSGAPVTCDDGDACTLDACDPATGGCLQPPDPCDDADACTLDSCDPATGGCSHDPKPFLSPVLDLVHPLILQWGGFRGTEGHWNSYRGTIPAGLMGSRAAPYDQVCLESADLMGDGAARTTDPGMPPPGTAFYYAVTQETGCGEGPPLRDSTGIPVPNPNPCLTPP